jgi:hypothetical protein
MDDSGMYAAGIAPGLHQHIARQRQLDDIDHERSRGEGHRLDELAHLRVTVVLNPTPNPIANLDELAHLRVLKVRAMLGELAPG